MLMDGKERYAKVGAKTGEDEATKEAERRARAKRRSLKMLQQQQQQQQAGAGGEAAAPLPAPPVTSVRNFITSSRRASVKVTLIDRCMRRSVSRCGMPVVGGAVRSTVQRTAPMYYYMGFCSFSDFFLIIDHVLEH